MRMHKPPHPGEFIQQTFLEPNASVSARSIAKALKVSPSTFNRLLRAESGVSANMAYRLSKVLGISPEAWLAMQNQYDLWLERDTLKKNKLQPFEFPRRKSAR